ncbi:MAG: hypothetical protein JWR20_2230, partial [Marmoricola sp.]|nr:hypothetical protein [Marmoricola sp.]
MTHLAADRLHLPHLARAGRRADRADRADRGPARRDPRLRL